MAAPMASTPTSNVAVPSRLHQQSSSEQDEHSNFVPNSEPSSPSKEVAVIPSSDSDSENATITSTPHLSQELIALILDALVEPYLYHPETGELDPYTASVVFVLRPIMLVSRSFAHYARRLGVRHLVLDYDSSPNMIPTVRQLILYVNRHQLGSAVRSLTILPDRNATQSSDGTSTASIDLISIFFSTLISLRTLLIGMQEDDLVFRGIIATLFATPLPFFPHITSLVQVLRDDSCDTFSIILSLSKLFPNLKHIGNLTSSGGDIDDFVGPCPDAHRANKLHLHTISLTLEACFIAEDLLEVNRRSLELLSENCASLRSLTLAAQFRDVLTGDWDSERFLLPYFPRVSHLALSKGVLLLIDGHSLLYSLPNLKILEVDTTIFADAETLLPHLPPSLTDLSLKVFSREKSNLDSMGAAFEELFAKPLKLRSLVLDLDGPATYDPKDVREFIWPIYVHCSIRSTKLTTPCLNWKKSLMAKEGTSGGRNEFDEDSDESRRSSSDDEDEDYYDSEFEGEFEMLSGDEVA